MTTYPVSMPSNNIESAVLKMQFANAMNGSPFSFISQVYDWGGAKWVIDFTLPLMKRETVEPWIAFALSLRGMKGTFLAGDPSAQTPRGVGGGTPLVNGASQTGSALIIDGAPISTTGWLKAGDYFQLGTGVNSRLHKLISDANTNGTGQVTLDFVPDLRSSPADNAAITITSAKGVFRLASNETAWTANSAGRIYNFSFQATEVL